MKLALWLMSRFGVQPSLMGDLKEEWALGRSPLWLLRQMLVAIGQTVRMGLWEHKARTIGAVMAAWIIGTSVSYFLAGFLMSLRSRWSVGYVLLSGFLAYVWPGMVSWLAGRLHRVQPIGTAMLFVLTFTAVRVVQLGSLVREHPDVPLSLYLPGLLPILSVMLAGALLAARKPDRAGGIA